MKPAQQRYEGTTRASQASYQLKLGTAALLSLFFALAIVCGLFFAFGYTLGKHAIPATFSLGGAPPSARRPAAGLTPSPTPVGVSPPNPAELGAAETNQTPATLTPPAAAGTAPGTVPPANAAVGNGAVPGPVTAPAAPPVTTPTPRLPAVTSSATGTVPPSGQGLYHVQVFAGIKADADSLAAALQQRGYPASVLGPGPGETDIYRVQVGPYLTVDEAQAMRSRLTADGYQAIVKP